MDLLSVWKDWFAANYPLRMVVLGSATLGIVSGALGTYAVLRKQSLLGDAISHAALPGIALAYLLTSSKSPWILVAAAAAAGWIATLLITTIVRNSRIKYDAALGLVMSVFFGLGLILLTYIQKHAGSGQSGLREFLYGKPATLMMRDVLTMAVLGSAALAIMLLFWKEFKLLSFDPEFGASLGFGMRGLDMLLTSLLVIAIVIGLQTVGVVLMSAMLVAPAAAARQWTDRLGLMATLSACFGVLVGVSGAVFSTLMSDVYELPPGPTIVLMASGLVVVSLFLAPNRGLVWNGLRNLRNRRRLRLEALLSDLYVLAAQHNSLEHGHATAVLQAMNLGYGGVRRSLEQLAARGWAQRLDADRWALTPAGKSAAEGLGHDRQSL